MRRVPLLGRAFANERDFQDQLDAWFVKVNARQHRSIRARPVDRLAEELEQVAAVIDAQERLRDRFFFGLLAGSGMRVGQALGLRHEDIVSWERRIG